MTIDERIEAMAQTMELLVRAQAKSDEKHAWVVDTLVRLEGNILDHDIQIGKLTATVDKLALTVDRYIRAQGDGQGSN
ncbi:MAG TPA: hypothetical protein VMT20_11385 [Terriglobia bacterium]|nr:hypothetical protein [Terriglobia bacterium]